MCVHLRWCVINRECPYQPESRKFGKTWDPNPPGKAYPLAHWFAIPTIWHLARKETGQALELLRPLALLSDQITPDPEADLVWRAHFILALLKSRNADGFHAHLDHLKDSTHPGIAAMRKLADEAGRSGGLLSKMTAGCPVLNSKSGPCHRRGIFRPAPGKNSLAQVLHHLIDDLWKRAPLHG
jgi:hypothetical protein